MLPLHAAFAAGFDLRTTVASDELFRGIPQNNSLTVGLRGDYRFDNRVYVGVRALNNRSQGGAQSDFYVGYSRALNLFGLIQATADGGLSASIYGDDDSRLQNPDYVEGYASLGVGPLRVSGSYAPDYFGTGAAGYRMAGQLKLPLPFPGLSATAVIGWNAGDGVRRLVASRQQEGRGAQYADYSLVINQELPLAFSAFGQVSGTTVDIDGSRAPTFLIGLRWRYGV
ncbi:MAG: TorF family putative porin [Nevskia sp.]|nr:TorF family putative porin [Nevskia sp.]